MSYGMLGKLFKIPYGLDVTVGFGVKHYLYNYKGKGDCGELHHHNWKIIVYLTGFNHMPSDGMLIDYIDVESEIRKKIGCLQKYPSINTHPSFKEISPTSENLAKWFYDELNSTNMLRGIVRAVKIFETKNYACIYTTGEE